MKTKRASVLWWIKRPSMWMTVAAVAAWLSTYGYSFNWNDTGADPRTLVEWDSTYIISRGAFYHGYDTYPPTAAVDPGGPYTRWKLGPPIGLGIDRAQYTNAPGRGINSFIVPGGYGWAYVSTQAGNFNSDTFQLTVPLAIVLIPFVAMNALAFKRYRQWRRQTDSCCLQCGYDLRASPDRCPECGTIQPSST